MSTKGSKDSKFYYGSGSGPCIRAMIAIHEKGLGDDEDFLELLSFEKKEHKSEKITNLNKRGQLPTMKLEGVVVNESSAICDYVEMQYKGRGTTLMPVDDKQKCAKALQRKAELEANFAQAPHKVFQYFMQTKDEDRKGDAFKKEYKERHDWLMTELKIWDGYLKEEAGYLVGDSFTAPDILLMTTLIVFVRFGLDLSEFEHLKKYYEKNVQRPSIQKSWPPHWRNSENKMPLLNLDWVNKL